MTKFKIEHTGESEIQKMLLSNHQKTIFKMISFIIISIANDYFIIISIAISTMQCW